MKYRQLGLSDLRVSEISLGSWLTYGGGVDRDRATACIHKALDVGINFFDTANVYGTGAAESFLGETLSGLPRQSYILGTKVFGTMSPTDKGLSRDQIIKQVDDSLMRLKTDYIDLYQCHRYDPDTPLEETMEALTRIVTKGKVNYIGFSEWPPEKIALVRSMNNYERFVSSQPQYSLLWPQPERKIFSLCQAQNISQIVFCPLGQGILTGKYRPQMPPPLESRASQDSMNTWFPKEWLGADVLTAVDQVAELAKQAGATLAQFSLAWVLRQKIVASAIVGASRPEQIEENAAASGLAIDPALFKKAEELLAPFAVA